MTLAEMIAAAQKRVNEATDDTAKAKAEAELAALKSVESAGYTRQTDLDGIAATARGEGRNSGQQAQRKAMLEALGIPDDENADAELKRVRDLRDGEKSEAERLKSQVDALTKERDEAKQAREEREATLRQRDIRDAVFQALDAARYEGKKGHAFGSVDLSKVEENEGAFDATKAVEALKEDEFPGFAPEAPGNPKPPVQGSRVQVDPEQKSRARIRQDRLNERMKARRG